MPASARCRGGRSPGVECDAVPMRVRDVAYVGESEGLPISRARTSNTCGSLSYDFRGPLKLAQRTHEAFMKSISVPPGYSVGDDRFEWEVDDSGKLLWLVFGAGLILVVLSVALVFDSVWAIAPAHLPEPAALGGWSRRDPSGPQRRRLRPGGGRRADSRDRPRGQSDHPAGGRGAGKRRKDGKSGRHGPAVFRHAPSWRPPMIARE